MYSPTEERLRVFITKLSEALTQESQVVVQPGSGWAAYPAAVPPRLVFKLEDVAVMLEQVPDEILSVTAHEIAHLLYTEVPAVITVEEANKLFGFDVGKYPRAAAMLLNAVEDSRIERIFSDHFPGARSLFDRKQDKIYDGKVQRGFDDLPIKWRFILNIDRVLHGLEPWGDERDIKAVEAALDACLRGMWADSTKEAAEELEVPFKIMVELMRLAQEEDNQPIQQQLELHIPAELLGLPSDYEHLPSMEDEEGAGGSGGLQGAGEGEGKGDKEQKSGEGKAQKGTGGKPGTGAGGTGGGVEQPQGDFADDSGLPGDVDQLGKGEQDKPANIIEEMVNEEKAAGSKNKAVDILSYRQRQRAARSKEITKQIAQEKASYWDELAGVLGRTTVDVRFQRRMQENAAAYDRDREALEAEIRTLRGYARQVLRDNDTQRFGGNKTSGRKIKTHRLTRILTGDPRLMERKELTGGKSYAIALSVDQSSSMRSGGKQQLAYQSALVFLEAFEGLTETIAIGFSDVSLQDPDAHAAAQAVRKGGDTAYARMMQSLTFRTYKEREADLLRRRAMIPELGRSFNGTPMDAGVRAAVEQLALSDKQVRALVVITDGKPNDAGVARKAFQDARRRGIEIYGMHIGGRYPLGVQPSDTGAVFLNSVCDHSVAVPGASAIPQAVHKLLRGVVRNRRAVV